MKIKFLLSAIMVFCLPINYLSVSKVYCGNLPSNDMLLGDEEETEEARKKREKKEKKEKKQVERKAQENRQLTEGETQRLAYDVDRAVKGDNALMKGMQEVIAIRKVQQKKVQIDMYVDSVRKIVENVANKKPYYQTQYSQIVQYLEQQYVDWAQQIMSSTSKGQFLKMAAIGTGLVGGGYALYRHGKTKGSETAKESARKGSRRKGSSERLEEMELKDSLGSRSSESSIEEENEFEIE
jgi:hypothetical protein